ncbi:hypothetical protein EVAR_7345_1 [Eumeta japonica]|uniref:Uncharacterized protein n=1 Tax=Eumeta variegata TaxID=151549 RepID=A0A4C1T2Q5_EUMVA|nr:hypothetical protein EVAR_7345_1 [Eumeta japonica]
MSLAQWLVLDITPNDEPITGIIGIRAGVGLDAAELWLADPEFHSSAPIDLLLEAEPECEAEFEFVTCPVTLRGARHAGPARRSRWRKLKGLNNIHFFSVYTFVLFVIEEFRCMSSYSMASLDNPPPYSERVPGHYVRVASTPGHSTGVNTTDAMVQSKPTYFDEMPRQMPPCQALPGNRPVVGYQPGYVIGQPAYPIGRDQSNILYGIPPYADESAYRNISFDASRGKRPGEPSKSRWPPSPMDTRDPRRVTKTTRNESLALAIRYALLHAAPPVWTWNPFRRHLYRQDHTVNHDSNSALTLDPNSVKSSISIPI